MHDKLGVVSTGCHVGSNNLAGTSSQGRFQCKVMSCIGPMRGAVHRACHNSLRLLLMNPEANKLKARQPALQQDPERAMARASIWWPYQTACWAICSSPASNVLSHQKTLAATQRGAHRLPWLQTEHPSASRQNLLSMACFCAWRPCPHCRSQLRRRQLPPRGCRTC